MIKAYRVVTASDRQRMEQQVNDLIKREWVPFGGISDTGIEMTQAMVKYAQK